MIHQIIIPDWRPAALNEFINKHWTVGHKLKKRDRQMILAHALEQKVPTAKGKRKVSLHITYTGRMKRCDPDAFDKSLRDALVSCHMLLDDTDSFVEAGTVDQVRGDGLETIITLEDL